jgi:predicted nucleic acid-binding Zn ribbon protein
MSSEPLKECPNCKGEVKRLIGTGAGTIFKGTGFYQTDYKNKSPQSSEKKNGADKTQKKESDKGSKKEKEN